MLGQKDGRLRVSEVVYQDKQFTQAVARLTQEIFNFSRSDNSETAATLLRVVTQYIRTIDDMFLSARPRFITTMRQRGGPTLVNSYREAKDLEKLLRASLDSGELLPSNVPEQKSSPVYAKIEGLKIVLDSGQALHPLLSGNSLERTRAYLQNEISEIIVSLESSNVDRRLVADVSRLLNLLEFSDDAGAIVLGLHSYRVARVLTKVEEEISPVFAVQINSTLIQISQFASQYKEWIEFVRNASAYPSREAVEGEIDSSVGKFIDILTSNPERVDSKIPEVIKSIEGALEPRGENRTNAVYAAIRGFENICIVAVKFSFDQVSKFLKEMIDQIRSYAAKTTAIAVVGLTLAMIYSFMPVIKAAPELNWILENISKIEKIRDLIK